jgi:hypothetical protein
MGGRRLVLARGCPIIAPLEPGEDKPSPSHIRMTLSVSFAEYTNGRATTKQEMISCSPLRFIIRKRNMDDLKHTDKYSTSTTT